MNDHEPRPYFTGGGGGGVGCTCGQVFAIGDQLPDTPKGKPSKRRIRNMRHAWNQYRAHWEAMQAIADQAERVDRILKRQGIG